MMDYAVILASRRLHHSSSSSRRFLVKVTIDLVSRIFEGNYFHNWMKIPMRTLPAKFTAVLKRRLFLVLEYISKQKEAHHSTFRFIYSPEI